jgi:hypothetical protein
MSDLDRPRLTTADERAIMHLHLDQRRRQEGCTQGTFSPSRKSII